MPDIAVELEERARVEELLDPFAGQKLALLALALHCTLTSRMTSLLAQLGKLTELAAGRFGVGRHDASVTDRGWPAANPSFE